MRVVSDTVVSQEGWSHRELVLNLWPYKWGGLISGVVSDEGGLSRQGPCYPTS